MKITKKLLHHLYQWSSNQTKSMRPKFKIKKSVDPNVQYNYINNGIRRKKKI